MACLFGLIFLMLKVNHEGLIVMLVVLELGLRFRFRLGLTNCSLGYFWVELLREVVLLLAFLAVQPKTTVDKLIVIEKLAFSASLVFHEISLIYIPISPVVEAIPMFSIQ